MGPRGVGAQALALGALIGPLRAEGLGDEARKRALPEWPRTVALVTSGRGAAVWPPAG